MLIIIEARRPLSILKETAAQLEKDFTDCNPSGIISLSQDLTKLFTLNSPTLVVLREPYQLVDCMMSNSKLVREFTYNALEYLHKENHHLAISTFEFRVITKRLRALADVRIRPSPTKTRIINITDGSSIRGITGSFNLWKAVTFQPDPNLEVVQEDQSVDNKILVTILSEDERKDYLVDPEKPFTLPDGKTITVTLPETPDINF